MATTIGYLICSAAAFKTGLEYCKIPFKTEKNRKDVFVSQ